MARTNYTWEKRQRELAKKKKKEEKKLKKAEAKQQTVTAPESVKTTSD